MKKAFFSFFITFLLVSSVAFADSGVIDNPYMDFADGSDFFTLGVSLSSLKPGETFLLSCDANAKLTENKMTQCSGGALYLQAKDKNKKVIIQWNQMLYSQSITYQGQRLSKTVRLTVPDPDKYGYAYGQWDLYCYIQCLNNGYIISDLNPNDVTILQKDSTCKSGWVGEPYCDYTTNDVYRKYMDCVNTRGIEGNRVYEDCSSTQLCENRDCRTRSSGDSITTTCGSRGGHVCGDGYECSTKEYSDLPGCCINKCYAVEGDGDGSGSGDGDGSTFSDWLKENKIMVLIGLGILFVFLIMFVVVLK